MELKDFISKNFWNPCLFFHITIFFCYIIPLFENRDREKDRDLLVYFPNGYNGLRWAKLESRAHPGVPNGGQGPNCLSHHLLLARVCISRKLKSGVSARTQTQTPDRGYRHANQHPHHSPKCHPQCGLSRWTALNLHSFPGSQPEGRNVRAFQGKHSPSLAQNAVHPQRTSQNLLVTLLSTKKRESCGCQDHHHLVFISSLHPCSGRDRKLPPRLGHFQQPVLLWLLHAPCWALAPSQLKPEGFLEPGLSIWIIIHMTVFLFFGNSAVQCSTLRWHPRD